MKSIINRVVVALVVLAMSSLAVLADGKSKSVTFNDDVTVNGTLVKSGTYKVTYDEQTGELSIERYNKTIAKTSARTEKRDKKAERTEVNTRKNNKTVELSSIAFSGADQTIVVSGGSASGSAASAQ
jgi:lipopolysaccharide export system protein LptA